MSPTRDTHKKSNHKLPLLNLTQITLILLVFLVNKVTSSPTTVTLSNECPKYCECDQQIKRVKCTSLDGLIATLNSEHTKQNSLQNVEALDLSNNNLKKLTNQLELLVNLKELNLSHNDLSQVSKWNFKHLKTLDLSHNHITSGKLSKIPTNLAHLNLSHNDITYVPLSIMKLKKLRAINLDNNPINCTCDTLHVRNFLTHLHVWSDNHIKCAAPLSVKGRPWLQAKHNEICHHEQMVRQNEGHRYDFNDYDDNELMLGDAPDHSDIFGSEHMQRDQADDEGSGGVDEEDPDTDEETKQLEEDDQEALLEDDFIPVSASSTETAPKIAEEQEEKSEKDDYEDYGDGSGDDSVPLKIDAVSSTTEQPSDDDGSGSEAGIISLGTSEEKDDISEVSDEPPMAPPTDNSLPDDVPPFSSTLGIFEPDSSTPVPIVPFRKGILEAPTNAPDSEVFGSTSGEIMQEAKSDVNKAESDDKGTLILLAIIGIALLVLIVFVAMKNRKASSRNRREKADVEIAPATELMDMKKPEKNGNGAHNENAPLIGDREKSDFAKPINGNGHPYNNTPQITVDEPAARQSETPTKQNGNIEPVHQSPSNGSVPALSDSDDVFHPALDHNPESLAATPEVPKRYSPIYSPASPKSDRYSPVYEPETGRVKIKLSETPKPKTPVVVSRTRSKAGDYITTPQAPNQRTPNGN